MRSLWSDDEAAGYEGDLGLRVYTSRLLGRDKSLVKGSGWDLEMIEAAGFSPLAQGRDPADDWLASHPD